MASEWSCLLTQKAEADLDSIIGYIAVELANPKAASDFADKLQMAIDETRSFPESGSLVVNEYLPDTRIRRKMVGNYIMYYLPSPAKKKVYVLRIVYGRRNVDEILRYFGAQESGYTENSACQGKTLDKAGNVV